MPVFKKNRGFTLVEIIVTVSIIGLISAFVVPNLRVFNKSQDMEAATSDLVQVLKKTQSNAMSRITCPSNKPTTEWRLRITKTGYQQIAVCTDVTGTTSPTPQAFPTHPFNPSTIKMRTNTCHENFKGLTVEIVYTGNDIAFYCIKETGNGEKERQKDSMQLVLEDNNDSDTDWVININELGLVDKEERSQEE